MFTRHYAHWPAHAARNISIPVTSLYFNLEASARRYPDKPAIIYYGRELSYTQLRQQVDALAGYLSKVCGVKRGDRVILDLQNSVQFIVGYYAILRANAVVVPANPMLRTAELRYLAADSGATTAIFGQENLDEFRPLLDDGALAHGIAAVYADYLPQAPAEPACALPEVVAAPRRALPAVAGSATLYAWSDALAAAHAAPEEVVAGNDLAVLPYTSGTTGAPKGCMHTHGTVMSTIIVHSAWPGHAGDNTVLAALPMFHVTGMQAGMNSPIYQGATIVIMTRWDREAAAQLIQYYGVKSFSSITTMMIDLLGLPALQQYDLSTLQYLSGGGAAMPEAVADRLHTTLGLPFIEGYGLSETIAPTHLNPIHRPKRQCAGIPVFGVDSRVVDVDTGSERGPGETGEIVVDGPQIFKGYWNRPEATDESFMELDGKRFFRTGDLGHYDEDGYFFITDRLKRMINASGFKVWPAEVEATLYGHPAISEACVIATTDAHRGETVKAIIVLKAGSDTTGEEIIAWARDKMAAYKAPRIVEFVDALPKTGTGKIFWRQLQEDENARRKSA